MLPTNLTNIGVAEDTIGINITFDRDTIELIKAINKMVQVMPVIISSVSTVYYYVNSYVAPVCVKVYNAIGTAINGTYESLKYFTEPAVVPDEYSYLVNEVVLEGQDSVFYTSI